MKKIFFIIILLIIIIISIFCITKIKNKNFSTQDILQINSETIRKKLNIEKEAADNIAQKLQENNIKGKIEIKDFEMNEDISTHIFNNNTYKIIIIDENNKQYTVIVNGKGWFGTIQNEDGKYIYYELDD